MRGAASLAESRRRESAALIHDEELGAGTPGAPESRTTMTTSKKRTVQLSDLLMLIALSATIIGGLLTL
jgi:hypothetical protein